MRLLVVRSRITPYPPPSSRPTASSTARPSSDARSHFRSSRRTIVTPTSRSDASEVVLAREVAGV